MRALRFLLAALVATVVVGFAFAYKGVAVPALGVQWKWDLSARLGLSCWGVNGVDGGFVCNSAELNSAFAEFGKCERQEADAQAAGESKPCDADFYIRLRDRIVDQQWHAIYDILAEDRSWNSNDAAAANHHAFLEAVADKGPAVLRNYCTPIIRFLTADGDSIYEFDGYSCTTPPASGPP